MAPCLAYFITWATYGTWLHGDERSSVDRRNNLRATPRLKPNASRQLRSFQRLSQEPMLLSREFRDVVDVAVRAHAGFRGWHIHALNVRTNHVHVVVAAHPYSPELVMKQFKEWGTRYLTDAGLIKRGRLVWIDHGSTRWVDTPESLARAIHYVNEQQ